MRSDRGNRSIRRTPAPMPVCPQIPPDLGSNLDHRVWEDAIFFNWYGGGWSPIGSILHAATNRPIVAAPGNYDDGEIGRMIGKGNRNTRTIPAPMPLCVCIPVNFFVYCVFRVVSKESWRLVLPRTSCYIVTDLIVA
jgi:hypothetical protein